MITRSASMAAIVRLIDTAAESGEPIMLLGETGTGKTMIARRVHDQSKRRGAFVHLNCSSLRGDMSLAELFGHVKGAFTGAHAARKGAFEEADGGTLFLDELGELPIEAQALLLRVVEDGVVVRVGEQRERPVDVRLVVATHRDLGLMIARGLFRQDLYYRLAVIEHRLPPLRDRPEDVVALATEWGGPLPSGVAELLTAHSWPGNVRELRNLITRCRLYESIGAWSRDGVARELAGVTLVVAPTGATGLLSIIQAETARQGCIYSAQLARLTGLSDSTLRRRLRPLIQSRQVERLGRTSSTRYQSREAS